MVKECTNDVWGVRRVGEQRGSEWCSEEVGMVVAIKRMVFEKLLQRRSRLHMIDTLHREL